MSVDGFVHCLLCFEEKAGVCVAGGADRPSAAEFGELSLSPWVYACQAMGVTQALAGIAGAAAGLHLVWPLRGPVGLGGKMKKL